MSHRTYGRHRQRNVLVDPAMRLWHDVISGGSATTTSGSSVSSQKVIDSLDHLSEDADKENKSGKANKAKSNDTKTNERAAKTKNLHNDLTDTNPDIKRVQQKNKKQTVTLFDDDSCNNKSNELNGSSSNSYSSPFVRRNARAKCKNKPTNTEDVPNTNTNRKRLTTKKNKTNVPKNSVQNKKDESDDLSILSESSSRSAVKNNAKKKKSKKKNQKAEQVQEVFVEQKDEYNFSDFEQYNLYISDSAPIETCEYERANSSGSSDVVRKILNARTRAGNSSTGKINSNAEERNPSKKDASLSEVVCSHSTSTALFDSVVGNVSMQSNINSMGANCSGNSVSSSIYKLKNKNCESIRNSIQSKDQSKSESTDQSKVQHSIQQPSANFLPGRLSKFGGRATSTPHQGVTVRCRLIRTKGVVSSGFTLNSGSDSSASRSRESVGLGNSMDIESQADLFEKLSLRDDIERKSDSSRSRLSNSDSIGNNSKSNRSGLNSKQKIDSVSSTYSMDASCSSVDESVNMPVLTRLRSASINSSQSDKSVKSKIDDKMDSEEMPVLTQCKPNHSSNITKSVLFEDDEMCSGNKSSIQQIFDIVSDSELSAGEIFQRIALCNLSQESLEPQNVSDCAKQNSHFKNRQSNCKRKYVEEQGDTLLTGLSAISEECDTDERYRSSRDNSLDNDDDDDVQNDDIVDIEGQETNDKNALSIQLCLGRNSDKGRLNEPSLVLPDRDEDFSSRIESMSAQEVENGADVDSCNDLEEANNVVVDNKSSSEESDDDYVNDDDDGETEESDDVECDSEENSDDDDVENSEEDDDEDCDTVEEEQEEESEDVDDSYENNDIRYEIVESVDVNRKVDARNSESVHSEDSSNSDSTNDDDDDDEACSDENGEDDNEINSDDCSNDDSDLVRESLDTKKHSVKIRVSRRIRDESDDSIGCEEKLDNQNDRLSVSNVENDMNNDEGKVTCQTNAKLDKNDESPCPTNVSDCTAKSKNSNLPSMSVPQNKEALEFNNDTETDDVFESSRLDEVGEFNHIFNNSFRRFHDGRPSLALSIMPGMTRLSLSKHGGAVRVTERVSRGNRSDFRGTMNRVNESKDNVVSEVVGKSSSEVTAADTSSCPDILQKVSEEEEQFCTPERSIDQDVLEELKKSCRSVQSLLTPARLKSCNRLPTAREQILMLSKQREPLAFSKFLTKEMKESSKKIGEGVYGEVFRMMRDKESVAVKIVPIEGKQKVNDEIQKTYEEILSEIVISMQLSALRTATNYSCSDFVHVKSVSLLRGAYPDVLLKNWDEYDEQKESENDRPDIFDRNQLYIAFTFEDSGSDLEAFKYDVKLLLSCTEDVKLLLASGRASGINTCHILETARQALSVVQQTACALAVAEEALQFEHRDLHWGNVLVRRCPPNTVSSYRIGSRQFSVPTHGVKITIIDFTMSRLQADGLTVYIDLGNDETLFSGQGNYQFDIYRMMRKINRNEWKTFHPVTNVYWLHYLIVMIIENKRYTKTRTDKQSAELILLSKDHLLNHKSCLELIQNSAAFAAL